eukprot:SAG11_NODE_1383_length_5074_cov_41.695276_6_plen_113_part_00
MSFIDQKQLLGDEPLEQPVATSSAEQHPSGVSSAFLSPDLDAVSQNVEGETPSLSSASNRGSAGSSSSSVHPSGYKLHPVGGGRRGSYVVSTGGSIVRDGHSDDISGEMRTF